MPEQPPDIPARRRRALVVVAEPGARELTVRSLEDMGFTVQVAVEPYEAVLRFVEHPAKLLVLSLEGLTRRDRALLRELRRLSPDLRVLLLVPEGRRRDAPLFLRAGADVLLPVPFYGAELAGLVRALLRPDGADPLTGLPNRSAWEHAMDRELERAKRSDGGLGFAILDLDHFGKLNRTYGYLAADQALQQVADRLRDAVRVTDVVARWGGEEFAVLLTGLSKVPDEAHRVALQVLERARKALEDEPVVLHAREGRRKKVTLSGGLAVYPADGQRREQLFDVANFWLARAKLRRNCLEPDPDYKPVPRPGDRDDGA